MVVAVMCVSDKVCSLGTAAAAVECLKHHVGDGCLLAQQGLHRIPIAESA